MSPRLVILLMLVTCAAACGAPPADGGTLPTLASLPSSTATPLESATPTVEASPSPTATVRNTITVTAPPASATNPPTATIVIRVQPTAAINEATRIAAGGRNLGLGAATSTPTSATANTDVEITVMPNAAYRPIVVAARPIPVGTTLGADDVRIANFPEAAIPTTALLDTAQIVGQTARMNFYCGMPIMAAGIGAADSLPVGTPVPLAPMNCDLPELNGTVELVAVVIAAQTIPAGEYIAEEAVVLFAYPRLWLPPGALYGGEDAVDGMALINVPREGLVLASMVGEENPNAADEEAAPSGP